MKIILAVDAIHRPLTGIGRYTWEIFQGLKTSPAITDLKFISHSRWVDKRRALRPVAPCVKYRPIPALASQPIAP